MTLIVSGACGGHGGSNPQDPDEIESLRVEPPDAELVVANGVQATQDFKLIAVTHGGDESDVTDQATFAIDDPAFGGFVADTFTATGGRAGVATVTGAFEGSTATADLTIRVDQSRVVDGAPDDAADRFASASADDSVNPTIVYPEDQTIMPPNIGDFEVHWQPGSGTIVAHEVTLHSDFLDLSLYLPPEANWQAFLPEEWAIAGASQAGGVIEAQVRSVTDDGKVGAAHVEVRLTPEDIEGGIYYWAAENADGSDGGIFRHDVARPGEPAEAFYTTSETPDGKCVGCHALSRDGTRMAVRYEGGALNVGSVVDVATGTEILDVDGTYQWAFAAFQPDGKGLVYAREGELTLVDVDDEMETPITSDDTTTQPDFSPDGTKLLYVRYDTGNPIWFTGGSIVTRSFDPDTGTVGPETVVVPQETKNVYYPSWSPDGQWILFNKSTGDCYDDADAELWVVKADGSMDPIRLDTLNIDGGVTNSWARWAPFSQEYVDGSGHGQPLFWLTWSSERAFGVRLTAGQLPQIWMAPFFPEQAEAQASPTAPAFRLPFQDIATHNHIAQWTERVIETIQ